MMMENLKDEKAFGRAEHHLANWKDTFSDTFFVKLACYFNLLMSSVSCNAAQSHTVKKTNKKKHYLKYVILQSG